MRFTTVVEALPPSTPFVAPEAIERQQGVSLQLRLGANESAFGISPLAEAAMRDAISSASWYGDPESYDLRSAIGIHLGIGLDRIVVGNGIDGLLGYVVRAFVEPATSVVTSRGTYPTFAYHVLAHGGRLHRIPYREDRADLDAMLDCARSKDARLLYLANPDNPAGTCHRGTDIAELAARLPSGCMLVLDEAYFEFAPDDAVPALATEQSNIIRLRTFSKAHGMAGTRVGYAIAHRDVIAAIGKFRNQFEVSRVSQAGALASLQDHKFVDSIVCAVDQGRSDYMRLADELGFATIPSATNFVCIDVGDAHRARRIVTELMQVSVFIRMPSEPPLDRCIRVTVGTQQQRDRFAEILRDLTRSV